MIKPSIRQPHTLAIVVLVLMETVNALVKWMAHGMVPNQLVVSSLAQLNAYRLANSLTGFFYGVVIYKHVMHYSVLEQECI